MAEAATEMCRTDGRAGARMRQVAQELRMRIEKAGAIAVCRSFVGADRLASVLWHCHSCGIPPVANVRRVNELLGG